MYSIINDTEERLLLQFRNVYIQMYIGEERSLINIIAMST